MVDVTAEVANELSNILETYCGIRMPNETGVTAFQNWWWQVQGYIQHLDTTQVNIVDGNNLIFEMPYWGEIGYSKYTIGKTIFILVTSLKLDEENFFQFIRFHTYSHKNQPVIIGDLNFNYKLIKQRGSRLVGIMNPYGEILIRPFYDRIIPFHHCAENFNKIHAIGIKKNRCFAIDFEGNTEMLPMDVSELRTIGCRHHRLGESRIMRNRYFQDNYIKHTHINMNKKIVRLTESDLHNLISEAVKVALNEVWTGDKIESAKERHPKLMDRVDWKTAARKARHQSMANGRRDSNDIAALDGLANEKLRNKYKFNNGKRELYPSIHTDGSGWLTLHGQVGQWPDDSGAIDYAHDEYARPIEDEFPEDVQNEWGGKGSYARITPKGERFAAMQKDMGDYFTGKSQYKRGKGWQ